MYGSPLELVNIKKEATNIASTSGSMQIISRMEASEGKVYSKKLLFSMTVTALKAMCSKLFKIDVLSVYLEYRGLEDT